MSDSDPLLAGRHVLVVDDEPLLAYDMADLLQRHGAQIVCTCMALDEAVAVIDSGTPIDCAVLDIQIGHEEIWPVARRLSARNVPFLFVSALCGMRQLPEGFEGRPFLPKPINPTRLRDALRGLIRT